MPGYSASRTSHAPRKVAAPTVRSSVGWLLETFISWRTDSTLLNKSSRPSRAGRLCCETQRPSSVNVHIKCEQRLDIHLFLNVMPPPEYSREVLRLEEILRPIQRKVSEELGCYYQSAPYQQGYARVSEHFEGLVIDLIGKAIIVDTRLPGCKNAAEILTTVSGSIFRGF